MTNHSLRSLLNLLRAADVIEQKVSGAFSSVHGLALKEVFMLMHLENAPLQRLTRVELSRRLHMSASTVTRMTAPLEKIRLVSRQSEPRDARLAFVVLTEAGKTKITEARTTLTMQASKVFQDRWANAEIAELSELLGRLVAGADGELK